MLIPIPPAIGMPVFVKRLHSAAVDSEDPPLIVGRDTFLMEKPPAALKRVSRQAVQVYEDENKCIMRVLPAKNQRVLHKPGWKFQKGQTGWKPVPKKPDSFELHDGHQVELYPGSLAGFEVRDLKGYYNYKTNQQTLSDRFGMAGGLKRHHRKRRLKKRLTESANFGGGEEDDAEEEDDGPQDDIANGWTCDSCEQLNLPHNEFYDAFLCQTCGEPRFETKENDKEKAVKKARLDDGAIAPPMVQSTSWICEQCTLVNEAKLIDCGVCDHPRGGISIAKQEVTRSIPYFGEMDEEEDEEEDYDSEPAKMRRAEEHNARVKRWTCDVCQSEQTTISCTYCYTYVDFDRDFDRAWEKSEEF